MEPRVDRGDTVTILITGGSGEIATAIRPFLQPRECRLLDLAPPTRPLRPGETFLQGDLTDVETVTEAARGADLVVHLGGYRQERDFDELLRVNIGGTRAVLEGARRAGTSRVLLASSVHAVGYATVEDSRRDPVVPVRPDSYYGVGKAALEALGSLYADRFSMVVVSARIAAFVPQPQDVRGLSLWCSPADLARLVRACEEFSESGHRVVWGVSANSRDWVRPDAGNTIGFHPHDDAEIFAGDLDAAPFDPDLDAETPLGGDSVIRDRPLGTDWDPRNEGPAASPAGHLAR